MYKKAQKGQTSVVLFPSRVTPKSGAKSTIAYNAIVRHKGFEFRVPVKKMLDTGDLFFGSSAGNGKRAIVEEYDRDKGIAYSRASISYSDYEDILAVIIDADKAEAQQGAAD